jgi:hypothetical protein
MRIGGNMPVGVGVNDFRNATDAAIHQSRPDLKAARFV